MKELDFTLATTQEIIEEFARRAKQKRKQNMQYHGTQKKFAQHIGMTHRRYQQFEINGKITLEKFIDVLRGLHSLDEVQELLELGDEELFKEKSPSKKKINMIDTLVNIPDVFS